MDYQTYIAQIGLGLELDRWYIFDVKFILHVYKKKVLAGVDPCSYPSFSLPISGNTPSTCI